MKCDSRAKSFIGKVTFHNNGMMNAEGGKAKCILLKCIHECVCAASAVAGMPLAVEDSFSAAFQANHLVKRVGIQHTSEL